MSDAPYLRLQQDEHNKGARVRPHEVQHKLIDRQVHWIERPMPYAHIMSILYRTESANEADDVSRRLDFFHPDDAHLPRLVEMFAL